MSDQRCPMCGQANPAGAEACRHCGARLQPLLRESPDNRPIRAGEAPVEKDTHEFEDTDFLRHLKKQEPIRPGDLPQPRETSELESTLPAWLRRLRGTGDDDAEEQAPAAPPPPAAEPEPEPPVEETPDWLADLTAAPADETGELPSWLADLGAAATGGADEPESAPPAAEAPAAESADVPDWLAGLSGGADEPESAPPAAEAPALESADLPDWLAGLSGGADEPESAPPAADAPAAESADLPDWLAGLSGGADEPESAPPAAEAPAAESADVPDWLAGLSGGVDEPESASPAAEAPTAESADLPDWLAGLSGGADEPASAPSAAEAPAAESADLPDWLAGLSGGADEPESAPPAAEAPAAESADLPDWLAGLSGGTDEPAAEAPAAESAETPDWLASFAADEGEEGQGLAELDAVLSEMESALPEDTPQEASAAAALILDDEDEALDALEEALPDWLAALKPDSSVVAEAEEDEDLSPTELPSWVQSMRPLEDVLEETLETDLATEGTEQKGPLAGLRGVLPINDQISLTSRPELLGYKLEVSEPQRQTVALLESLLEDEKQALTVEKEAPTGALRFIRWGLTLALLLVVSLIYWTDARVLPPMSKFPPETLAFMDTVNQLDTTRPVVVVVDYDPAFVGEMDWALSPVVQHLQVRGATVITLSTSPTGAALAQRLMPQAMQLGYLPGGSAGILGWALSPTTTMPRDVNGVPIWQTLDVQSLNDLGLIVVATHDPTLARQWVEQLSVLPLDTPVVMVISAQAEPLVRPYYDSGQLAGLVTGVVGGESYATLNGFAGAGSRWSAYGMGLILAALLVAVGGLWSLVDGWQSKRQQAEAEE